MGGAAIAAASGCGAVDGYDCHELMACDYITEDGTNNAACLGTCVDADIPDFDAPPRIVWIGPASEQPSCKDALLDGAGGDGVGLEEYERLVAEPDGPVRCEMEGDYAKCPSGGGAERHVFSERFTFWKVLDDSRDCTPCACTETAPSTCEALVSTFEDEACTDLLDSTVIRQRVCHDADPGSALGSMRAEWRVNAPGECASSGGELVGELVLARRTLCCMPEGT
ncbi:hypothetical protein [Sorangium sp. So ce1153]|uniref:hypothetical protein n=1 Tax=Sorangium sp. So ce1153 TaxID=3133333 RepID=UPI003F60AF5D